jgi:hypothetical protein
MWVKARSPRADPSAPEPEPAPEPGPGRRLVATERALLTFSRLSPLNLVVLVGLDGPALDDLLTPALAAAQQRHPLLRARIAGPPSRPRFEVSPGGAPPEVGPIPLTLLPAADAASVFAVAEAEMNTPFDTGRGPLARLTRVSGSGQETSLVLTLHHAIADGTSTANLLHELLDWCRSRLDRDATPGATPATPGAAPGAAPLLAPLALPPPLTGVLPASLRGRQGRSQQLRFAARQGRDEIGYRLGSRGQRRPVPPPGRAATRPLTLDRDQTASLVDRARRRRLTLTSLLSAALLWQASALLYEGRPTVMRAVVWVDLRPHLDPPVGSQTLGCYVSMIRFTIRVDPRTGFAALAAAVQDRIERAARRGDRLPAALLSAPLARVAVRWPVGRLGTTALSYAVTPAIRPSYGPVRVRELRAFVSNLRLGAELAGAAGMTGGALWCNLLYLDSDIGADTASAAGDGLLSTLLEFARA